MIARRGATAALLAVAALGLLAATAHAGAVHVAMAHFTTLKFPPMEYSESYTGLIESWHEFYLMAGTASVTLVGLLFVAISLHLDVLLHHTRAHLLDLARQTMLAFVYVMIVSLMVLVPPSVPRVLAMWIGSATIVVLSFSLVGFVRELRMKDRARLSKSLVRRRILQIVALAVSLYAARVLWDGSGFAMFVLIGPICAMLGNGTGSAWDLLVQLGRLKVKDEDLAAKR